MSFRIKNNRALSGEVLLGAKLRRAGLTVERGLRMAFQTSSSISWVSKGDLSC